MEHWEIFIFFLIIAFIYSSVGFGGGSSYLAILALYALPFKEMRLIALICNIIVVTGGSIIFIRNKQVNFKKILPLVLVSVPMAFAGATVKISQDTFFILLGISPLKPVKNTSEKFLQTSLALYVKASINHLRACNKSNEDYTCLLLQALNNLWFFRDYLLAF